MRSKLWGLGVFAFWAVMMTALVRIEYASRVAPWDEVPVPQVFRRILTNTDPQWLNVYHQDKLAGFLRLDVTNQPPLYRVEGELSLRFDLGDTPTRLRVTGKGLVTRRLELGEFEVQGLAAGTQFTAHNVPGTRKLAITYDMGAGPQKLEFDPQAGAALAATLGLPATMTPTAGTQTRAYHGRLTIGHEAQRVFIIETMLHEAAWAKVWVDEAGQILQVDTSAGWRLRAEVLDQESQPAAKRKQR